MIRFLPYTYFDGDIDKVLQGDKIGVSSSITCGMTMSALESAAEKIAKETIGEEHDPYNTGDTRLIAYAGTHIADKLEKAAREITSWYQDGAELGFSPYSIGEFTVTIIDDKTKDASGIRYSPFYIDIRSSGNKYTSGVSYNVYDFMALTGDDDYSSNHPIVSIQKDL